MARGVLDAVDQDLVTVIDEETDRMTDLVTQAIKLAFGAAGSFALIGKRVLPAVGRGLAKGLSGHVGMHVNST